MKNTPITIGDVIIKPGERLYVDLPLPPLYTHTSVEMPVHVINGRQAGPVMFVTAAIHGDEINGIEIIRRLLATKALRRLSGTLIAVPVVNVYGFVHMEMRSRSSSTDGCFSEAIEFAIAPLRRMLVGCWP